MGNLFPPPLFPSFLFLFCVFSEFPTMGISWFCNQGWGLRGIKGKFPCCDDSNWITSFTPLVSNQINKNTYIFLKIYQLSPSKQKNYPPKWELLLYLDRFAFKLSLKPCVCNIFKALFGKDTLYGSYTFTANMVLFFAFIEYPPLHWFQCKRLKHFQLSNCFIFIWIRHCRESLQYL